MNITIFGSGYVGLVTAACFAEVGNHVVCVDVDARKVATLQSGKCPFYEPGLDGLLTSGIEAGRLRFTTDAADAVRHGTYQLIAVGTPPGEDGSADLQYVLQVARTIAAHLDDYRVIINKSTVPVGTADKVRSAVSEVLAQRGVSQDYDVVSNPEFLKEGAAVGDFRKPDRIIVGADTDRPAELMRSLYEPFNRNHDRVLLMDVRSAELTKYAANAMLATKISFMNEVANIAERVGADVELVRRGMGSDPRIGFHFIYPGCGYGGSCFPKDVKALAHLARETGFAPRLLDSVEAVNHDQKRFLHAKMRAHFGSLAGRTIALWGLAFKPNTDDMREAPSRELMEAIWADGGAVRAYDPVAMEETRKIYGDRPDLTLVESAEEACEGADALALVTEWKPFQSPNFELIASLLKEKVLFDGRNLYNPETLRDLGFRHYAIGRAARVAV
ncbi:UDP-glucose/GDP-mannose dehydrogenase family protein [Algiphilus sp. W345]|uniref:UDP-glucose 6-dehydrogenase n=1 Tax=Banduia mediterranea TaxID=3075609 RepID=A0ABU2WJZ2_9GAMM|nr:UDP-glucose/GDP-mannose dehydrogenase family protein [Algiphilus sp. W345]MDT0498199.1 UDP-glucose/GDP-mannose dehydrogenase family protein [Algiphilus sp. W345]